MKKKFTLQTLRISSFMPEPQHLHGGRDDKGGTNGGPNSFTCNTCVGCSRPPRCPYG